MKRFWIIIILCAALIQGQALSQALNIVEKNGGNDEINLSEIDSVTYSLAGSASERLLSIDKMIIFLQSGTETYQLSAIDSLYFNSAGTVFYISGSGGLAEFNISDIDSITFGESIVNDSAVVITYNGNSASVVNPYEGQGVSVSVDGADVIVTSTSDIENINYILNGTTPDGMFKIYSDIKLVLGLNGVNITNNDGPAINIQTGKKITVQLAAGTNNVLSDGVTYAAPPNQEDQDAAFFSEGQLIFYGSGSLEINGTGEDEHGLRSDDYIEIHEGNITINSAVKDGVHTNDGFFMYGGSIDVTSSGDGIDGGEEMVEIEGGNITVLNTDDDNDAIKSDAGISISGGVINLTVEGDQSKGLNTDMDIIISGGTLNINTSGGVVLEASGSGYDPSYCTAIKTDAGVTIESADVTIVTTGAAGRGISCDGNFNMYSGTLEITSSGDGARYTDPTGEFDAYHGPCIKADGNINIRDCEITLNHSGDGGKGISCDNDVNIFTSVTDPVLNVTTTGNRITIVSGWPGHEGEYEEAKAITVDSTITIESGAINISSADDGIKTKKELTINGGVINITNSVEGLEGPNLYINGGEVNVVSSDDAVNSTYGIGGEQYDGSHFTMNDGYLYISASGGDALDSNGDIFINGGVIVAHGPQSSPEVGLDVNGVCLVSGGFVIISGTNSFMTEGPSSSSTQRSVLLRTNQVISAGTLFHIEDSAGNDFVTFRPVRRAYSMIFSSSDLSGGTSYKVYTGGNSTGTEKNGLYTGGTYSGGSLRTTFTINGMAPTVWF